MVLGVGCTAGDGFLGQPKILLLLNGVTAPGRGVERKQGITRDEKGDLIDQRVTYSFKPGKTEAERTAAEGVTGNICPAA